MVFALRVQFVISQTAAAAKPLFTASSLFTTASTTTITAATRFSTFPRVMTLPVRSLHGVTSAAPRHLLSISDLTQQELASLVKRAADAKAEIKKGKTLSEPLRNALERQTVAMMFSKRSTRTRVSTEGAIVQMGGHPMFLGKDDIQLGVNESLLDTSKVLSSMTSCIVARVGPHSDIVQLSAHSTVPVINALSDSYHPLQAVTDILTIKEAFPDHDPHTSPLKIAWVGDANNVLYDLMTACGKSGMSVAIATPREYSVDLDMLEVARRAADEFGNGARIFTTNIPLEAVKNADIIVTDTWISMGQESEKATRLKHFSGYQVSSALADRGGAKPHWKFMHCLPRKSEEVTDEVFYNEERSLVFQEAENRLYAAIAALEAFVVKRGKIME
ncbi:Aspartate/ornithine carbamoyltransferase [Kalaharituber pfeilii]|nr:Aspartate/ornithine carbamoyltransferase [Kalaharituber pfeilii]